MTVPGRPALAAGLAAGVALAAAVPSGAGPPGAEGRAAQGPASPVRLGVGDTVEVDGAGLGCEVTRRHGRLGIECRVAGRLSGTYGTLLTERSARITRFRSSTAATVVVVATHGGRLRTCPRAGARARRRGRAARARERLRSRLVAYRADGSINRKEHA